VTWPVTDCVTIRRVADDDWYKPHRQPTPQRQATPGELLFEFVRERDHKHFRCELRFHGESYGWEAQFVADGDLLLATADS
jgi:hypothetical protein